MKTLEAALLKRQLKSIKRKRDGLKDELNRHRGAYALKKLKRQTGHLKPDGMISAAFVHTVVTMALNNSPLKK